MPNTSEQYNTAQEELSAVTEEMQKGRLAVARKAIEEGNDKKAIAELKAVLKFDPKHSEAKLMLSGLSGGNAAGAGEQDKGKDKGAPEAKPAAGANTAGKSSKSLMEAGMKAYHSRKWSEAKQSFSAVAKGSFDKKSRSKASGYFAAVKDVAAGFTAASSASNPLKRARAYKKAYNADHRIDGHFGPALVGKLTKAYVEAAQMLFKGHRYAESADAVREAMNFDPENAAAQKLEQQCINEAGKMLKKAKDHMGRQNYATARDYARQVTRILPAMDPRAAEARKIRQKASEASIQGDDD